MYAIIIKSFYLFTLHRGHVETYNMIRSFDNFLILLGGLYVVIVSELHSFPFVAMEIQRGVPLSGHFIRRSLVPVLSKMTETPRTRVATHYLILC